MKKEKLRTAILLKSDLIYIKALYSEITQVLKNIEVCQQQIFSPIYCFGVMCFENFHFHSTLPSPRPSLLSMVVQAMQETKM